MCVCISLSTIAEHNTAQNSSDNLSSYPPDDHHDSDVVGANISRKKLVEPVHMP